MKTMLITTTFAAALGTAPAMQAATPESFATSLGAAVASQRTLAESASGEIQSIADDKASFVIVTTGDSRKTITVSDTTVYMLDGKKVDRDKALKIGRQATITHENGKASRVEVSSKDMLGRGAF